MSAAVPTVDRRTGWVFGAAGVAVGTINTGLNFFLLVYYDQVLGLHASLAGLALAIALVVDGIMDPLVGLISDRWRSPLGRRHPFIYASIVPLALSYVAIWFPPFGADRQGALFGYLLGVSIALRVSQTLFDVPTNALLPELTQNYETRTTLSIWKTSLTWMTSNVTGILMYAIWLRDDGAAGAGLMNRAGYQAGALWFAGALVIASVIVPVGLRRFIPMLRARADAQHPPATRILRNLVETYSNRSILALLAATVFLASASGLTNAIWVYLYSFFWGLASTQVNVIQLIYLAAALLSLLSLPRLARGRDKRALTLRIALLFWAITALPYALASVGAFPGPGSTLRLAALGVHALCDGILFNMLVALLFSLLADVVEDSLLSTGRREEGLILASQTFVTKVSSAVGTALAASVLTWIAFPRGVAAASIPADVLHSLGVTYVTLMWLAALASTVCLTRYSITRQRYSDIVARVQRDG